MTAHNDGPGGAATPQWWPPSGMHPRAAALKLIGGLEKLCGLGAPMVSAVTFEDDRIDLLLSSGRGLTFAGPEQLQSYVATCTAGPATAPETTPEPGQRELWEQWWEMLLDLSTYPSYFLDLHPRLEVIAVQRRQRQSLITVGNGKIRETYSVALVEGESYPVGIPDDIRYSFNNDMGPPAPFAKKLP